jgi:hypothetical protein
MRALLNLLASFRREPRSILLALSIVLGVGYAAHAGTVTFSEIVASSNAKLNLAKAPAVTTVVEVNLSGTYGTGFDIPRDITANTILNPTNTRCRTPLLSIETAGTQTVNGRFIAVYDEDAEKLKLYEIDDETTGGTTGGTDTGSWYDLAEADSTQTINADTVRLTVMCRSVF